MRVQFPAACGVKETGSSMTDTPLLAAGSFISLFSKRKHQLFSSVEWASRPPAAARAGLYTQARRLRPRHLLWIKGVGSHAGTVPAYLPPNPKQVTDGVKWERRNVGCTTGQGGHECTDASDGILVPALNGKRKLNSEGGGCDSQRRCSPTF